MGSITRGIANNILGSGAVDASDGLSGTIPANNIANASLDNLTAFPPSVSAGIPQVASDPPSPSDGDVWYNTTSYKLKVKGYTIPSGTWATGGNLGTARYGGGGAGTQTAALVAGGNIYPPGTPQTVTELYDGSSWTEVNDLNTGRNYLDGCGTQTAGLIAGGTIPGTFLANTESWDGTNWTEVNDINTARSDNNVFGTSTAAVTAGGTGGGSPGRLTNTESWNGTSWTEVNDLNTAKQSTGGSGLSTSAILAGGSLPPHTAQAEEWDGTSWTEVNDLNTARSQFATSFGYSSQSSITGGGNSPSGPLTVTEYYNGTSWTELADLSVGRRIGAGAGSTTAGLGMCGYLDPGMSNNTEEWTAPTGNLNVTLT